MRGQRALRRRRLGEIVTTQEKELWKETVVEALFFYARLVSVSHHAGQPWPLERLCENR